MRLFIKILLIFIKAECKSQTKLPSFIESKEIYCFNCGQTLDDNGELYGVDFYFGIQGSKSINSKEYLGFVYGPQEIESYIRLSEKKIFIVSPQYDIGESLLWDFEAIVGSSWVVPFLYNGKYEISVTSIEKIDNDLICNFNFKRISEFRFEQINIKNVKVSFLKGLESIVLVDTGYDFILNCQSPKLMKE
jgi:hypothetical protein